MTTSDGDIEVNYEMRFQYLQGLENVIRRSRWIFPVMAFQVLVCQVQAATLGSPLRAREKTSWTKWQPPAML
jgi:hypothetical protein